MNFLFTIVIILIVLLVLFALAALLFLLTVPAIAFFIFLAINGFSFVKLCGGQFKIEEQEISDDFQTVSFTEKTGAVAVLPSDDGTCKVVSRKRERMGVSTLVEENTLTITPVDNRAWYQKLFNFGNESVTLYLPESVIPTLSVKNTTGSITIGQISANDISVSVKTGKVDFTAKNGENIVIETNTGNVALENVRAKDLTVTTDTGRAKLTHSAAYGITVKTHTGNITLENVRAKDLSATTNTGRVVFEGSDAKNITATTTTGSISGTLLTDKIFVVKSGTGKISIPETIGTEPCKLTSKTGSIKIAIAE